MISIIDYGMGNVGSIVNMIKKAGGESRLVTTPEELENAKGIILPGVGSFDNAMKRLNELKLIEPIKQKALIDKIPVLGICLGMQLLTLGSEEGKLSGLGLIDATTLRFVLPDNLKIPHMGWNYVISEKRTNMNENFLEGFKYYFVHSYFVKCDNEKDVLLTTNYGCNFCSAFQKENIIGVQFHPEKSHNYGLKLLKNFWEMI